MKFLIVEPSPLPILIPLHAFFSTSSSSKKRSRRRWLRCHRNFDPETVLPRNKMQAERYILDRIPRGQLEWQRYLNRMEDGRWKIICTMNMSWNVTFPTRGGKQVCLDVTPGNVPPCSHSSSLRATSPDDNPNISVICFYNSETRSASNPSSSYSDMGDI